MEKRHILSTSSNVKAGIFLAYFAVAVSVIVHLIYTPFLLNQVGDTQYGLKSFVESITTWLSLLTMGMSSSYIRFATLAKKENGENGVSRINGLYFWIFSIVSVVALIVGLVIVILFRFGIVPLDNYSDAEKSMIVALMVVSVFSVSVSIESSVFSLHESYKSEFIWIRLLSILSSVLVPIITVFFLLRGGDILIVSIVQFCFQILMVICNVVFCFCHLHMHFSTPKKGIANTLLKEILIFSFYVFLTTIVETINSQVDITILGFLSTAETVTIYQLGASFRSYELEMSTAFSSTLSPRINELSADNDLKGINNLFLKSSRIQTIILFLVFGGFTVAGRDFVIQWLGQDRVEVFYVAFIILGINLLPFCESTATEIQRARNLHKFRSVVYCIAAIVNVVISVVLVLIFPKDMAIWGCIIGTVITVISANWIVLNIYNHAVLKLDIGLFLKQFCVAGIIALGCDAFEAGVYNTFSGLVVGGWVNVIVKSVFFAFIYMVVTTIVNWSFIKGIIANKRANKQGKQTDKC